MEGMEGWGSETGEVGQMHERPAPHPLSRVCSFCLSRVYTLHVGMMIDLLMFHCDLGREERKYDAKRLGISGMQ